MIGEEARVFLSFFRFFGDKLAGDEKKRKDSFWMKKIDGPTSI